MANAFREAAPERRRQATLAACEAMAQVVGFDGNEDVSAGLRAVREGVSDAALRERLAALSSLFDDQYFRLAEEGDKTRKPEALRLFAKARGASAVALAFSMDSSSFHEAIYEAMSALNDDPVKVVRAVESALSM